MYISNGGTLCLHLDLPSGKHYEIIPFECSELDNNEIHGNSIDGKEHSLKVSEPARRKNADGNSDLIGLPSSAGHEFKNTVVRSGKMDQYQMMNTTEFCKQNSTSRLIFE